MNGRRRPIRAVIGRLIPTIGARTAMRKRQRSCGRHMRHAVTALAAGFQPEFRNVNRNAAGNAI